LTHSPHAASLHTGDTCTDNPHAASLHTDNSHTQTTLTPTTKVTEQPEQQVTPWTSAGVAEGAGPLTHYV